MHKGNTITVFSIIKTNAMCPNVHKNAITLEHSNSVDYFTYFLQTFSETLKPVNVILPFFPQKKVIEISHSFSSPEENCKKH